MALQNSGEPAKKQRRIQRSPLIFPRFVLRSGLILLVLFALPPLAIRTLSQNSPACVDIAGADYLVDLTHWAITDYALGEPAQVIASPDNSAQAILMVDTYYPAALVLKTAQGQRQLARAVYRAVWSHMGNRLFYVSIDPRLKTSTLMVVDQNGNLLHELLIPTGQYDIVGIQLSADDQLIAVFAGKSILVYHSDDFQLADRLPPASFTTNFSWSPLGHLALSLQDDRVLVWSPEKGLLLDLPGQSRVLRWSPDGQWIALLTKVGGDEDAPIYRMSVYSLDGSVARRLFDTKGTRITHDSDPSPRVLWLDAHTLALWHVTRDDGRYALAHYDVTTNQYTTIIDDASEAGVLLPDKEHVLYRVKDGDHVRLMLGSVRDGHSITLAESFGTLTSFYTLNWSPDATAFALTLYNRFDPNKPVLWSRNDGTKSGLLPTVTYSWLGTSTFAYSGDDAKGAYAGFVNIQAGTATRVLEGVDHLSLIPVEQVRRYGGYIAFYWQKTGAGSALDLYTSAGERLYRLPYDLNMDYMNGPYLNPVVFLSPDARLVIPRSQVQRLKIFADGQLVLDQPAGNPEDVLWFPDSSAALLLTNNLGYYQSEIWQVDRAGKIERSLDTPYLSRSSHKYYRLNWCPQTL